MEMSSRNDVLNEDMLIGACQEDGVELINTYGSLDDTHAYGGFYPIDSGLIITGPSRGQDDVANDEKWLVSSLDDPTNDDSGEMFVKKVQIEAGEDAIKIKLIGVISENKPRSEQVPFAFTLHQDFNLVKIE